MIKNMKPFTVGKTIMVKCCMVFDSKNNLLSLTAEKMQPIGEVKAIITEQVWSLILSPLTTTHHLFLFE
jgi:hypothetical protein